jgi:UDP-N-acetyl-D-mannosaminuronate dehydrogenase
MKNELINRIQSGNATIGVVGLGYVGLLLALRFAETGFKVIGFDVDAAKAGALADRQSYFSHIAHERVGQAVNGSNIMLLGIAYKKDTSDKRISPDLRILAMLRAKGANVTYHDPHVPHIPELRAYDLSGGGAPLTEAKISAQHCNILRTDHTCVDYETLARLSDLIADTRGVFLPRNESVVPA